MDPIAAISYGLSRFGVDYAIMGIEASVIAYLFKKLMDTKETEIQNAKAENERSEKVRESLQRTTDNIFTFIQSHSVKNNADKRS